MARKIDPAFAQAASAAAKNSDKPVLTDRSLNKKKELLRPVTIHVDMTWEEIQAAEEHNRKVKQQQQSLLRQAKEEGRIPVTDGWRKVPVFKG